MHEQLVKYYTEVGVDSEGRAHNDILSFSNEQLESTHDFIQWIFPTNKASAYNKNAPILDQETIDNLKNDAIFEARFNQSLKRIFDSFGLKYKTIKCCGRTRIIVLPITEKLFWMEQDHHYLVRFSRVMRSCRILGFESTAKSLFEALLLTVKTNPEYYFITPENIYYWYCSAFGGKFYK